MKITFLGTSSAKPTKERNTTCIAITLNDGKFILVDCGEGAQLNLMKSNLKFSNLTAIYITHLHGDHVFGLPGLLATLNEHRKSVLNIYGPKGIREFISGFAKPPFCRMENYGVNVTEINNNSKLPNLKIGIEEFSITPCFVKHTVECYCYIIDKLRRIGKINFEKIKPVIEKYKDEILSLGYKHENQIISEIKNRKDFEFKDGFKLIHNDYITYVDKKRLTVLMDNYNSDGVFQKIDHTDYLIHECTFANTSLEKKIGLTEEMITAHAIKRGHSTARMAGIVANKLKSKNVCLTHFSNRYDLREEDLVNEIIDNVREVFDGDIICAKDMKEIELE